MNVDVDGLRAAAEAATAGPWVVCDGVSHEHDLEMTVCAEEHLPIAALADEWWCPGDPGGPECASDARYIAAASPDVMLALLDRLQAAEAEVALLREIRDMDWDADAPMPESTTPEWGTEDYRRHAVLFNDITHAHLNARLMFSDRLRLQRTLWALGWRRDVRPEDVTEKADDAHVTAPLSASGAESDHGDRREGEGLA